MGSPARATIVALSPAHSQLGLCAVQTFLPGSSCVLCAITNQVDTLRAVINAFRAGAPPSNLDRPFNPANVLEGGIGQRGNVAFTVGLGAANVATCLQTCARSVGRIGLSILTGGASNAIGLALCVGNTLGPALDLFARLSSCEYDRRQRRSDPSLIRSAGVFPRIRSRVTVALQLHAASPTCGDSCEGFG